MLCRPLQLRQPFVFYLGHLPAFCDARLIKVLQQPLTEPAHYADMFARGIDPDLDDPTQCECYCCLSETVLPGMRLASQPMVTSTLLKLAVSTPYSQVPDALCSCGIPPWQTLK